MIELTPKAVKIIAQISVPPNTSATRIEVKEFQASSDTANYLLAACAVSFVTLLGVTGNWLRKYFDTRLEMSIARQKEEFANNKEDRDRSQARAQEDRERTQKQADIFLTTTLSVIKEEKDSYLEALQGVRNALEKIDNNQLELTHQIIELKGETSSNTVRIAGLQQTIGNIHGNTQQWESDERRIKFH